MPAITKTEQFTFESLNELKRKDLLNLCKEHGIKATGKNSELIEKLLEVQKHDCNTDISMTSQELDPQNPPMTPQKKSLPLLNEPGSVSVIKSIVQSARKTGLHSSPIRVPFALSPMAAKLSEAVKPTVLFSPMKSKEPSQPIKEAFLNIEGDKDDNITVNNDDNDGIADEVEDDYISKLNNQTEVAEEDQVHITSKRPFESEYILEDDSEVKKLKLSVDFDPSVSSSFSSSSASASASADSFHSLPPTNFSADLLKNFKDPEFTSPELISVIDSRKSRNEIHDGKSESFEDSVNLNSLSKSSSNTSSKSQNSLLPSGIVKLLERKRLEKEQQQQQKDSRDSNNFNQTASNSFSANQKKKFDLKESLKRPLPYKPHIGSVKPAKKD